MSSLIKGLLHKRVGSIVQLGAFRVLLITKTLQRLNLRSHRNKTQGRDLDDQAKHKIGFYLFSGIFTSIFGCCSISDTKEVRKGLGFIWLCLLNVGL